MTTTIKIEDLLNENADVTESKQNTENLKSKQKKKGDQQDKFGEKPVVPRGKPKSGRIWKTEKKKFSSIIKTKGIRDKFEKKQKLREDLKRVKEASRAIVESKKQEIELRKQRRRDNIKRREENNRKSEVVQVISNVSKLKRMRKKQLRHIEKRDTLNM